MIENKVFVGGGLNQDADDNFLKPNEWENALNIRVTDRLNNTDGVVSNIKGNTLVSFTLPAGTTNKCIGSYANENTGKLYSFIWNSGGFHTITEYDPTAGTITKVLQSKTDTGGTDILNFQEYELINGVGIVGGNLLYWTDGYNPPRNIDITKAKATSGWYTTSTSISLIKRPPQELIIPTYGNDTNTSTASNRLKNQLFQFRYLYVYQDNSRSAWSSCSVLPYPDLEISSSVDTTPYKNNNILLQFDVGDKYVKSIEIAAQVKGVAVSGTTQDWFSILTVDRDYIIGYPGYAEYSYDSITNNATYKFFNDGLYPSIDIQEIDLQYDFVPLKSKCLDVVNGNVLVVGNNTEGYDNLPTTGSGSFDVDFNISYVAPGIEPLAAIADPTGLAFQFSGVPVGDGNAGSSDAISATWNVAGNPKFFGPYYVPAADSGSLYDTAANFGQQLAIASSGFFGDPSNYYVYSATQQLTPNSVRVTFTKVGNPLNLNVTVTNTTNLNNSAPAYKTNSKYQMGLVYYDEFNRSTYVQTNERVSSGSNGGCILATSSWGAAGGQTPSIDWTINHSAPTWATKYQWVRTEQLTHKKFLFWAASSVNVNPNNSNLYDLGIGSLNIYNNDNNNSILSYQYSAGDRCTIHSDDSGFISGYDVGVVDYDTTTGILTIQKAAALSAAVSSILLEVYTPKIRQNTTQDKFFYEFGEVYSCSGGVHATTSGTFDEGDIYDKTRQIAGSGYVLEDPNFSDFYVSNYSSNGRTNIYAPQAKQLTLPTDIRFSDTYVPNTNINGLSRFYGDAYETYDRINGSIQKLAVRDNYLMTFQELKTGYIPILQSIIEDQGAGDPNVAISNKLLNKIRYFVGDYGIGTHPESFARFAGTMYFSDPNRGQVLKLTSGLQPIGVIGMDSYFTKKISELRTKPNGKANGSYDPYNDEYVLSFRATTTSSNFDETIAFSEQINRWTSFYSFVPDVGGYIFNQYVTYRNGALYTHNTNSTYNSFYGSTSISYITILFNSSPTLIKTFLGLIEQSNYAWVPTNISTSNNQISSLAAGDFSQKENVFFASFLRDVSFADPNGINGDDLKGNWIKLQLANGEATKATLFSTDLRYIPSYQGVK